MLIAALPVMPHRMARSEPRAASVTTITMSRFQIVARSVGQRGDQGTPYLMVAAIKKQIPSPLRLAWLHLFLVVGFRCCLAQFIESSTAVGGQCLKRFLLFIMRVAFALIGSTLHPAL